MNHPRTIRKALERMGHDFSEYFKGAGCKACRNTGYKGRLGIHELLVVSDEKRDAIVADPTVGNLRKICDSGQRDYTGTRRVPQSSRRDHNGRGNLPHCRRRNPRPGAARRRGPTMSYQYRVRDAMGNTHTGSLEAASVEEATGQLRRDGFQVLDLEEEADENLFPSGISRNELIYVTSQLALMVDIRHHAFDGIGRHCRARAESDLAPSPEGFERRG